jgi:transcriptional regulator with XRE-family HTH domain
MNKIVGAKIKNLRKQKGLTQEEVADYLHITQPTYARIETGESSSWASYLEPISKLFDIQPEELVKQESINVKNIKTNNGALYNVGTINQISDKLIEQFEARIAEKDMLISELRVRLKRLE